MKIAMIFTSSAAPCGWEEDCNSIPPSSTAKQREAVVTHDPSALN